MRATLLAWLCGLALCLARPAAAEGLAATLERALAQARLPASALAQPVDLPTQAPTLLRQFMTEPPSAWHALDEIAGQLPALRHAPGEVIRRLLPLGTPLGPPDPSSASAPPPIAPPPTLSGLVPDTLPEPLAGELRAALHTLAWAQAWRQKAFAALPADLSPATVLASALPSTATATAPWAHWTQWAAQTDTQALLTAQRLLLAAAERLHDFVTRAPGLPPVAWRVDTEDGTVLVDTTGRDNHHRIDHPLLVLDVGGNDRYDFGRPGQAPRAGVKLVLDHGGNDHYRALAPGADAAAAVMGVALQWDSSGDDRYEAGWLAQGAAVLGAAVLIDDAGDNHYQAAGLAQGFAFGGLGVLLGSPGHDRYRALAWAQASAGPQGLALLLEPAGDDVYHLGNEVLVWPSSQLPERNASMGQGAAFGGLALLLDAAGNDRHEAQVFAQGAGHRQGTGLLLDLDGDDQRHAAWYAMGAAAHQSVGLLWDAGAGNDRYEASHVTAMGAGHDASVGLLVDGGGADAFALGDLGLGAAHDGGHGVLARAGGTARYRFAGPACRGLGGRYASPGRPLAGTAVFFDAAHAPARTDSATPCPP